MRRVLSLVGLGYRRVLGRLRTGASRRVLLTVCGVALAVALMTTVTGVALGLAADTTVRSDGVDYWIVPEQGSASSIAVSVEGPQLGDVHATTDRLAADDRIEYVTPVQLQVLRLQSDGATEYVLAIGVIPPDEPRSIAGLSTAGLSPGDPHYANSTYNGSWTGEAIASDATAELLNASEGTTVRSVSGSNDAGTFTVTRVEQGDFSTGLGPVPVVLVHLAELQTLTGSTGGDQADQLLVSTNDPSVRSELETVYPRTQVVARGGLGASEASTESLPLAVAVTALLSALIVGTLFVATLMGLEVTADRETLAALAAMGSSARSRSILVFVETLSVTTVGGIAGVLFGIGSIFALNAIVSATLGVGTVARFHPLLGGYGVLVALGIGLLASPYPILVARRTDVVEVLSRS